MSWYECHSTTRNCSSVFKLVTGSATKLLLEEVLTNAEPQLKVVSFPEPQLPWGRGSLTVGSVSHPIAKHLLEERGGSGATAVSPQG